MTTLTWIASRPTLWVVGAVYGLGFVLVLSAGLLGIWLGVLLVLSLWRYGYSVLRYAAQGRPDFPAPELSSCNPFGEGVLIAHFLLFPGVLAWSAVAAPRDELVIWYWIWQPPWVAVFPASAALVAITDNLLQSLNPKRWWHLITVFRWRYLGVVAGFQLLLLLSTWAFAGGVQGGASALRLIAGLWLYLAGFAFIGAMLRQHRDQFEIPGSWESVEERKDRHALEDREVEWRKVVDRAHGYLRSGKTREGYAVLREITSAVKGPGEALTAHQWLFESLWDWRDKAPALAVARALIDQLVAAEEFMPALEVFRRCRRQDDRFLPNSASIGALAAQARAIGQESLAAEFAVRSAGNGPSA